MIWSVYILFCDQKIFYVGITDNLKRRLLEHKNGYSKYNTRKEAEDREKQIKGWTIAKKIALIKGDKNALILLSKSREVVES